MSEWKWEKKPGLKGQGKLVNYGGLFSSDLVENLRFNIKGKLASGVDVSELVRDTLEKELMMGKLKGVNRYLPISVFELVLKALWRIKIRKLRYAIMNDRRLAQENYIFELCERIIDGEKVNRLNAVMANDRNNVEIMFKFRNRNASGEIVFAKPLKERLVNRFTRHLDDLVTMFDKDRLPFRRGRRSSVLAQIFVPSRYRYGYYHVPSGHDLGSLGVYDFSPGGGVGGSFGGSGSGAGGLSYNVTRKD
jgi:hypothetical protein